MTILFLYQHYPVYLIYSLLFSYFIVHLDKIYTVALMQFTSIMDVLGVNDYAQKTPAKAGVFMNRVRLLL